MQGPRVHHKPTVEPKTKAYEALAGENLSKSPQGAAGVFATIDQLRAWADDKPKPIKRLVDQACTALRRAARHPNDETTRAELATLLERIRLGQGMH